MTLNEFHRTAISLPKTDRFPALLISHGSPMNGVEDNEFSRTWIAKSAELPIPQAILCISAHLAIPTPEHYYPLLYTLGAQHSNEQVHFFAEGITHGSISMRSLSIY